MALTTIFATQPQGNIPASTLDVNFNQVGAMGITQCTATGTNTIALTQNANQPTISAYANYLEFGFVAVNTTTGVVTANVNGIGAINVYRTDGAQATTNDILSGTFYVIIYNSALNSGGGGLQLSASNVIPTTTTPQGRLTLVTGVPVMVSDQTAKTIVYYAPYIGNIVPLYDGSRFLSTTFTQLTLTLNTSDNLSATVYDIFVYSVAGVVSIGTGPAWTSTTARGTGAATTELQQTNGLWVNKNAIVLRNNGVASSSISISQATYVGTIYCTANGQTGVAYQPAAANNGTNNILGLYNAYNRLGVKAICRDNTNSWTYTSATLRAANASNSNRISFVDGLQQSHVRVTYNSGMSVSTTGTVSAGIAIGLDSTNTQASGNVSGQMSLANTQTACTFYDGLPQLGFHFIQALETNNSGAGTSTFGNQAGNGQQYQGLILELEM